MSLPQTVCRVKTEAGPTEGGARVHKITTQEPAPHGATLRFLSPLGTQVIFYQKGNESPIQGCTHRKQALQKGFGSNHTCNEGLSTATLTREGHSQDAQET